MTEFERNEQVADEICRTFRWKDRSFQRGECVLLIDGDVHTVSQTLYDVVQAFEKTGEEPSRGMAFEVRQPVVDVIR